MSSRLATEDPLTGALVLLSGPDTLFTALGATSTGLVVMAEHGNLPLDIWLRTPRGAMTRVTQVNRGAAAVALPRASVVRWRSTAGDTLEAQLFLPESGRRARLPLVVMPYGGYTNEFPRGEYFLSAGIPLLTARGFAVVRPNTRDVGIDGSIPGYGRVQLEDSELLVESLQQAGMIDSSRVAVLGHSHGGALAYYFLTHSTRFCAVVPVNGWSDWTEIAERIGGPEAERAELLRQASPLPNAAAVRAPCSRSPAQRQSGPAPHAARTGRRSARWGAGRLALADEGHLLEKLPNQRQFWQRVLSFLGMHCATGG